MLRELADAIERLLSIIAKRSWQLRDCKKENTITIFKTGKKDLGNKKPVNLTLFPGTRKNKSFWNKQVQAYEGQELALPT